MNNNQTKLLIVIEEAKRGKNKAQSIIIESYWNYVYNYIFSKIKQEEEAEDITIETFTKVFAKLKLYNQDFKFSTWIVSIAHNTMIDHIRKTDKIQTIFMEEEDFIQIESTASSPEEILIGAQEIKKLEAAIKKLPEKYAILVELRFMQNKTYKEIAEELNMGMPNVKVSLLRAKKLVINLMNRS